MLSMMNCNNLNAGGLFNFVVWSVNAGFARA
jgi:hypothetical protein